jgi:hypothetical protein
VGDRWEDCIVLGLEAFPMGLSMQVAGKTVYAQMHAPDGTFEVASLKCALSCTTIIILL